jgi:hypothetical protein
MSFMLNHEFFLERIIGRPSLWLLIRNGTIKNAGNRALKIYGTLGCKSGKRLKPANRVFFTCEEEAVAAGYRPCGHCLKTAFQSWKATNKTIKG